jgi:hypothetical protein
MKHGKKYLESLKLYNRQQVYEVEEAMELVLRTAQGPSSTKR